MSLTLAVCSLNQWALDFEGNYQRIRQSVIEAKQQGACYRLGPELEVCGYGANDHFFELDTFTHSLEILAKILSDTKLHGIIIDIGMPVIHQSIKYNCRVVINDGQILFVRPKMALANDGNYRESRWFTPYIPKGRKEFYMLPLIVRDITGQSEVPFGAVILRSVDVVFGSEVCEELFTPQSPHIAMGLQGVDVFTNGSGSHHELRKLQKRVDLIRNATLKSGGIYMYSNLQGCDGERVYYDGCSMIVVNGQVVTMGSQFSLNDVDVVVGTVDLESVQAFRGSLISRGMQAVLSDVHYESVFVDRLLCSNQQLTKAIEFLPLQPAQEIALGPACWLWDYLRRSGMSGFFLPLSGGIDSCSTAVIVYSMCCLVVKYWKEKGEESHLSDVRRVVGDESYNISTAQDLCNRILHTSYMASSNSGQETRARAKSIAESIGAYHFDCDINVIFESFVSVFTKLTDKTPQYKVHGGTQQENLALQNIQARSRMVLSYMFAQLLPWFRSRPGSLLVLGSSNVDECLRGYFTKYDCSSADLNPIGSISKTDLRLFIEYAKHEFQLPVLGEFLLAKPTAELEPTTKDYIQEDEVDMGFTYDELSLFGKLRKIHKLGPVGMVRQLIRTGYGTKEHIKAKVCQFFYYYAINRHKMTTLTPSYHAESYSPDDNRFDLRPFLYNSQWTWQKRKIEEL